MRRLLLIVTAAVWACACGGAATPAPVAARNRFAMRTYFMGFLRRGPAWTAVKTPESAAIGAGHMAHINGAEPATPGARCTE